MKITFVGVGAATASSNLWQSNMIVESNGKLLLIDAGTDIRHSLAELPYGILNNNIGTKIDSIWLSHLHADHAGGLEHIALCSKYVPPHRKPTLYCIGQLMDDLWENTLKGGLQTIEGKVADLTDFFECKPIEPNGSFIWESVLFQPVQTLHVVSGRKFQNSWGLIVSDISKPHSKIFLTTDTQFCPRQLQHFYDISEVIFHDCETSQFRSNVHAHYDDLKTLDIKFKKKMWLYHYNQDKPNQDCKLDGFAGFVTKGQIFNFDN